MTKGKKFNKITDILLIFLLVVVGVDFSEINPAFFLAETKKECLKSFYLQKLIGFWPIKKSKGFCLSRKTGDTHYLV